MFAGKKHSAWPFGARTRLIVWLLIAGVLWVEFLFFLQYRDGMKRGYTDFAVFYTAGTILRQGLRHQLYDRQVQFQAQESFNGHLAFRRGPLPFIHPPFEAPLFEPLSYLRYPQAFLVWDLLTAVMLFAAAAVLRRSVDALRPISTWKLAVASFAFYPVFTCFMQGQDSILQLLLCAAAFSALRKNHELQAGCWLALAAFKLQFMLPLVMLLFLWRRRRMVWGFAAVGVILLLVSLAVVGEGELLRYPHSWWRRPALAECPWLCCPTCMAWQPVGRNLFLDRLELSWRLWRPYFYLASPLGRADRVRSGATCVCNFHWPL